MTKREKIFRHIEDCGNAMRYTDIIKFAYEITHGEGSFHKKRNRGFYSDAFAHYSFWGAAADIRKIGKPRGHFVRPTKTGHLVKLSNGLWSVVRPDGWKRSDEDTKYSHENSYDNDAAVPEEDYKLMCDALAKYFITPDQLDERATSYWEKGDGDVQSCYSFAFSDFLREIVQEEKAQQNKNHKTYIILYKTEERYISEGLFDAEEVESFFIHRNPKDYSVMEVGNTVTIEKTISTSVKIK